MGNVFQGWRRKCGLALLLVSLVAVTIWLRSVTISDVFIAKTGRSSGLVLQSCKDGILAIHVVDDEHQIFFLSKPFYRQYVSPTFDIEPSQYDWRWQSNGFQLGQGRETHRTEVAYLTKSGATEFKPFRGAREMVFAEMPHWALCLPLSLLSAYLILIKPRAWNGKRSIQSN